MNRKSNIFRADLHVHTILSPCGDIKMTPWRIVAKAKECGLDIIGICDHNSTLQCAEVEKIGKRENIFVLCGAEITTCEEVHCLAFFSTFETLQAFQAYLEKNLPSIPNDIQKFGCQLVVDETENVLKEFPYLLISALSKSIADVETEVHRLNGIFIPAHIDKKRNSILSQLGFIPSNLRIDALELSKHSMPTVFLQNHSDISDFTFIRSSDAHFLDEIGYVTTLLQMETINFNEIKNALQHGHVS